jgi:hypothetical protein
MTFAGSTDPLPIQTAVASLPMPPTAYGALPAFWNYSVGGVAEFELDIWASATAQLTLGEIVAAIPHPLVYADNALTSVDHTADTLTKTAHALKTGDGPIQLTTSGTLPAGLATATNYWAIRSDANTIKLASSLLNALSLSAIDFTSNGSGTHTIVDTPDTKRIWWHSYGALQTPIDLSADLGFSVRSIHREGAVAYAVVGTLSAGTLNAAIVPVVEVE